MPFNDVDEQPNRYSFGFQIDLGSNGVVGIFQATLERGASGLSEAQMDEASQIVMDHLATMPNLATGSLTAGKENSHVFSLTPTEE